MLSARPEPGSDPPAPTLSQAALPDTGWRPPPDGTMWILERPAGLAVVTAEWYDPTARDVAHELAGEILDSITFGA